MALLVFVEIYADEIDIASATAQRRKAGMEANGGASLSVMSCPAGHGDSLHGDFRDVCVTIAPAGGFGVMPRRYHLNSKRLMKPVMLNTLRRSAFMPVIYT